MNRPTLALAAAAWLALAAPAAAEFPYPACGGCADPADYQDYLFNPVTDPPTIISEIGPFDFRVSSLVDPGLPDTPEELFGVAGMSVDLAWQTTTGRPDVVIAILDSGILYDHDTIAKAALNAGELPLPQGSAVYDANGDGVFNIHDYAGDSRVADVDGNSIVDPRDLILTFSDAVDDDGNGYTDDICGWDTHEHDNDPFDDVRYGHGTGEAEGAVGEVNDGGGWGIAPSAMFVPVKVSDSFIADVNDFAAGVVFAVDSGVSIVSEALGTLNNSAFGRAAVEYAWNANVPFVASAADEQSYHHNFPANYDHVFWANSYRGNDDLIVPRAAAPSNLLFNGCTNFGGKAQVAIASNACSSEATERAAGIYALLLSAAKNEIDRGSITAHPSGKPLSPNELIQLMQTTADDIDFSSDTTLPPVPIIPAVLPHVFQERFPTHAGRDKYSGYGRANAAASVSLVGPGTIPPEADIVSPRWYDAIDPTVTPTLDIVGSVAAHRNANDATYSVDWACGVAPVEAAYRLAGHDLMTDVPLGGTAIDEGLLAMLDTTGIAAECGFDTLALPRVDEDDFDESYTVSIRLRVVDSAGNTAEAVKNVTVYEDPSLRAGFPIDLGASGESAPVLADLDGDDDQEIVYGTSDGEIHVRQHDGTVAAGWPATTNPIPLEVGSAGYQAGALGSDWHNAILGSVAVGDLDDDGTFEVVAADTEGFVYAFEHDGSARGGFPVRVDLTFSDPSIRDRANRLDAAVAGAPTLADLDGDGTLEILVAAADRHLYVWREDGSEQSGFPVLVVDQERMASVDPVTHRVVWKTVDGRSVGSIGTKLVGSPSVGDLDGDGDPEIVVGSNEEYSRGEDVNLFIAGAAFNLLRSALDLPNGRVYALSHLGNHDPAVAANPSGPFLDGWPVRVGMLLQDLLPTVGHGVNANPVLADIDDDGDDEVLINPSNGPAVVLAGDGTPLFGAVNGATIPLDVTTSDRDNPGTDSADLLLNFPLLGSGAAADIDGDTRLDLVLPGAGAAQTVDSLGPERQGPSDHQVLVWSLDDGQLLPDFPRRIEDLQFLTTPTVADVDGDGTVEIVQGSGGYYIHAFTASGGQPPLWPKFTGGWTVGAVAIGDLDGNDRIDVVATTREGRLYAWEEDGSFAADGAEPVAWATLARDRRHSGNVNSGVPTSGAPPGCRYLYRPVVEAVSAKFPPGAGNDRFKFGGFVNMGAHGFDPPNEIARVGFGDADGTVFAAEVPAGSFRKRNRAGTRFSFGDRSLTRAAGIRKIKVKRRKQIWEFTVRAKDVDATIGGATAYAFLQIGDVCLARVRGGCESRSGGSRLQCG